MHNGNLQLTVTGRRFTLSPLPSHLYAECTIGNACGSRASHRLLSRVTASVELMCDAHTLEWAQDNRALTQIAGTPAETAAAAQPNGGARD